MQYLLLIYSDENQDAARAERMSESERNRIFGEWMSYTEEMKGAKVHLGGEALQPTATATCVRVRHGERLVSDGPFAETKEQLGGFYFIEAANLDAALAWAAKCPGAKEGTIEVRPVMKFD
jgi:hypothetical protein